MKIWALLLFVCLCYLNLRAGDSLVINPPPPEMVDLYRSAQAEKDIKGQINSLIDIGFHYSETGHYELAMKCHRMALHLSAKHHEYAKVGKALNKLGLIYRYQGKYEIALQLFAEAARLESRLRNEDGLSLSYYNISTIFARIGNDEKALEYIDLAIEIDSVRQKDQFVAANLVTKGLILSADTDTGIKYLELALPYYASSNDSVGLAMCHSNIGFILAEANRNQEALESFKSARGYIQNASDLRGHVIVNQNLADTYFKVGEPDSAQKYADFSFQIAQEIGKKPSLRDIFNLRVRIARANGEHEKALELMDEYLLLKDEILNFETVARIEKLETKYETQKHKHNIKLQQQRILMLEQESRVTSIKFYAIIASIIFLFVMTFTLYRAQKRKRAHELRLQQQRQALELEKRRIQNQKLAEEIEYKNRELQNLANNIVQKNQLLENIRTKIKTGSQSESKQVAQAISVVIDSDREEFEQKIDNINSLFYKNIKDQFSNLTEKDFRLLSLVKMNMSSKEMAILLGINPASVDVARYRLRKKLGLTKQVSLAEFLKQF